MAISSHDAVHGRTRVLAVIGGGPRAIGVLERIAENLRAVVAAENGSAAPFEIHVIDPFPPGPGRIWRRDQSPLLKLNSMAADVTVYTDQSSTIEGVIAEGPSLIEWVERVRDGVITDSRAEGTDVWPELAGLRPSSFPTRRLNSYYLGWFYRQVCGSLAGLATVTWHRALALSVRDVRWTDARTEAPGETDAPSIHPSSLRSCVTLDNGAQVEADAVLYALGHNGRDLHPEQRERLELAERGGLLYIPPEFTADADLSGIRPGENVIVRGFGLAAIDLIVLLSEGRGGRFTRDSLGALRYQASMHEPRLFVGSRRGVPYRSKTSNTLRGEAPAAKFFTRDVVAELVSSERLIDFRVDVWPQIARDLVWGYYRELATGHPQAVTQEWCELAPRLEEVLRNSADILGSSAGVGELTDLLAECIIDPDDRFDLPSFDRPLVQGNRDSQIPYWEQPDLQRRVRAHIARDLRQRTSQRGSASLGLFHAALGAYLLVAEIPENRWTARSRVVDIPTWWQSFFSYIASGPPGHRLEEVVALADAGILTFIGPDMWIGAEISGAGRPTGFTAGGSQYPGEVRARVCVDAWLPESRASVSDSPALRNLVLGGSGGGTELSASDADFSGTTGRVLVCPDDSRVVGGDGVPRAHVFAVGPFTTAMNAGAFSRPGINALPFRENDRVALALLKHLNVVSVQTEESVAR